MSHFFIGVDLGGTKIAAALLDTHTGQVTARRTVPAQGQQGPDAVLQRLADLVQAVATEAGLTMETIGAVGVGVPATVDREAGCTLVLPNLPGDWYRKPVVEILQGHLQRPVALINDARAFTLAEATLGAGQGAETVVCVTLGTGIGGGIAINGRLHFGIGTAGEVGHHSIDMDGAPDGTGNPGGWESLASGPAIAALGVKAVMQGITTKIGELAEYDLNKITPETIMRAAEQGDAVARDILERAGFYIGTGVANLIVILGPNRVILGGGLLNLGDWIMQPIHKTIAMRCHTVEMEKVQILPAALGNDAGMIGAALYASQQAGQP